MKLLYLEIENYGNLTGGRRIDFGGALQQFNEANGYGKTTLCSFIRVMFYGMKSRRENDTSFGDREHFYPFSGGRFGGSLTFFHAGKTCRIERFFDEKTATRDTFKYYENGAETAADGDKIGKEIFGLDEEAFIRALTFDAREAEIAATDGMKERLGAIAEGTAGGRNAAAAIEILEIKFPVVKFRVECSKGTYIRSLCADIGEKLCCGGTMQSLVRTRVGEFRLADALTLAQLQELRDTERLEEALLPTDRIFSDFPMLHVEEKWRKLIDNGNAFYPGQTVEQTTHPAGEWVRIYREDDSFVGIYAYDETKEWYKPVKIFPSNTESRK